MEGTDKVPLGEYQALVPSRLVLTYDHHTVFQVGNSEKAPTLKALLLVSTNGSPV